jgi:glycosyltransferase involved in cell wall biosynthesis
MRIGIDARFYGTLGKGLGRYTSELIRHLEKHDQANDYVIFLRDANFDEYTPSAPNFTKVRAEVQWYSLHEQLWYPWFLRKFNLDLMHFLHFNVPFFYRKPYVVTIHDLILLSHPTPRMSTLGPLLYRIKYGVYKHIIRHAIAASRTVLTFAQFTKNEMRRVFPEAVTKPIIVSYQAASPAFAGRTTSAVPASVAALPTPFLLYVGNAYPHKNLERLIAAFQQFRAGEPSAFSKYHLVLVGAPDYFYDRVRSEAAASGLAEHVHFFGKATDEELRAIYDAATAYVFPSLCEGFGLPPLEAMARNIPVASSNSSCLPEILHDAALYFDPMSTDDIARAMREIVSDQQLREQLVQKGAALLPTYSWDTLAKDTIETYLHARMDTPQP